jgi:hypothetical protein
MRILVLSAALVAFAIPASADAPSARPTPAGYTMYPNAQGKTVLIKIPRNFAECMHSARHLGYSDGDGSWYCSQNYPH